MASRRNLVAWLAVGLAVAAAAVAALRFRGDAPPPPPATLAVADRTSANVSLASSGPTVVAVWSAATAGGEADVFAAVSTDSGRTFGTPVRVNSQPGDARVNGEQPPRVALAAAAAADHDRAADDRQTAPAIAVVWTAKGAAGTEMHQAASHDGGRTFTLSSLVPGTDAPGNRGWEGVGAGPGGRFFAVWLDHRRLAPPDQAAASSEHEHGAHTAMSAPTDGVAMAQLSQLYVAPLDGSGEPQAITGGVCYCCKTAIAAGPGDALFLAWRHVYEGNMRDIAFTVSRDGGRTFAAPVRVSQDRWQINGCPDDGPAMVVDSRGAVHVVWPTVVTENGGPVKALFYARTEDGRTFTPRQRIPTAGQANHPQLAIDAADTLAVTWDEAASGTRALAAATGRLDASGQVSFVRVESPAVAASYPVLAPLGAGRWLRASTTAGEGASTIRLDTIP